VPKKENSDKNQKKSLLVASDYQYQQQNASGFIFAFKHHRQSAINTRGTIF
jgi:hypothetical protein